MAGAMPSLRADADKLPRATTSTKVEIWRNWAMLAFHNDFICDKNTQMHVFIVSFSYLQVNILDGNRITNFHLDWSNS